jgi:hypothetical protein
MSGPNVPIRIRIDQAKQSHERLNGLDGRSSRWRVGVELESNSAKSRGACEMPVRRTGREGRPASRLLTRAALTLVGSYQTSDVVTNQLRTGGAAFPPISVCRR